MERSEVERRALMLKLESGATDAVPFSQRILLAAAQNSCYAGWRHQ